MTAFRFLCYYPKKNKDNWEKCHYLICLTFWTFWLNLIKQSVLKVKLRFFCRGAVAVTMDLLKLDINQCPDKYYVPNAFKDTNKCDQRTSYVSMINYSIKCTVMSQTVKFFPPKLSPEIIYMKTVKSDDTITLFDLLSFQCIPILGRGFESGGYKCECKQGYEYPFEDAITYYDGQLMEAEFSNMVDNNETRFDMFRCRLAAASSVQANLLVVLILVMISFRIFENR